jgi:hypothetical protein
MALLEESGGTEDEYLLGCGTEFEVTSQPTLLTPEERTQIFCFKAQTSSGDASRLSLRVKSSPSYTIGKGFFSFNPQ